MSKLMHDVRAYIFKKNFAVLHQHLYNKLLAVF